MEKNTMPSHHGVFESENTQETHPVIRLLTERASCRNFLDKKIPEDVLEKIFQAGIHSATGGNLQPFSIIRIEDQSKREKLTEFCGQKFMKKAPLHLLFCIDYHRLGRWAELEVAPFSATHSFRHFWIAFQDTIICAQNMCTAIDGLGLGSVYIGTIIEYVSEVKKMFELPQGVFPVVLLCVGYPKGKLVPRKKLDIDTLVHTEKYHLKSDEDLLESFNKKYPNLKVEITDERLKTLAKVCKKVHGEKFAKKCLEKVKENGYIKPVQRYFGLHYRADFMPEGNEEFLKLMKGLGFDWFEKWEVE